jgi:hypothetical protein
MAKYEQLCFSVFLNQAHFEKGRRILASSSGGKRDKEEEPESRSSKRRINHVDYNEQSTLSASSQETISPSEEYHCKTVLLCY